MIEYHKLIERNQNFSYVKNTSIDSCSNCHWYTGTIINTISGRNYLRMFHLFFNVLNTYLFYLKTQVQRESRGDTCIHIFRERERNREREKRRDLICTCIIFILSQYLQIIYLGARGQESLWLWRHRWRKHFGAEWKWT